MTHPHRLGFNSRIPGAVVSNGVQSTFSLGPAWPRLMVPALMLLALTCASAETPVIGAPVAGIPVTGTTAPATAVAANSASASSASTPADPAAGVPAAAPNAAPSNTAVAAALIGVRSTDLPEDPGASLAAGSSLDSSSSLASSTGANPTTPAALPDSGAGAPDGSGQGTQGNHGAVAPMAPVMMKYIPPGYTVHEPLTADQKIILGLRDLYNPLNFAGMFASAGYEQLFNEAPNYGVDRGAFGERLGAAAIRESTQGIFTDAVFSPLLREDPRYYIEGPQYNFFHRTFYAITRPFITRDDSGRHTINGGLLLGYAAASGLSYTYYPKINQDATDTVATFGAGLGGAALGFFVSEFSGDVLHMLHIGKQQ